MTDPYNPNPQDPNADRSNSGPFGQQPPSDPYGQSAGGAYGQPGGGYGQPAGDPYAQQPGAYPPGAYPPGGHPGAGYPGGYPQGPAPQGTNTLAITSLVCGIVGFFCCGILSIVGLVTGFMAMNQIKQTGQDGHGMALAGTIVSGVSLVVGIGIAAARLSGGF